MAKRFIIVENGVIKCSHGGQAVLVSSVPVHVIGGKKPLYDIDFLGAVIKDCPNPSANGGPCTEVVVITSVITESNVANKGKNYFLGVDGCQTDKGVPLILEDPGQNSSSISVKSGGSASDITTKALVSAKLETKENISKEIYRAYPIRKSNDCIRGLRGARYFDLRKDYYHLDDNSYQHNKVITATDAYLYVTFDNKTTEYEVINRGDTLNPVMQKVQYKDTKTKTIRKYIPFYKEKGKASFVYSNIRLETDKLSLFTPSILTLGDTNADYLKHYKDLSKSVKHTEKDFSKKVTTLKNLQDSNTNYKSVLIEIKDPIGEVEDLYNEYEFSYHRHYGMNKSLIDDIRAKNQYPYAVADMLEYMHVAKDEEDKLKERVRKLQEQFQNMIDIIQSKKFSVTLNKKYKGFNTNLSKIIDFDLAKDYLDEVKFMSKSFFEKTKPLEMNIDNKQYYYLDWLPARYTVNGSRDRLRLNGQKYTKIRKNHHDVTALVVFSLCYSKKYESELNDFTELVEAREKFYYLLKTAHPLPQINDKAIKEIQTELLRQTELNDIFQAKKPEHKLFEEFESLEALHKELSFDTSLAKTKNKNDYLGFKALFTGKTKAMFFEDSSISSPHLIAKKIASKLKSSDLSDAIDVFMQLNDIKEKDLRVNYYNLGLNLVYMLSAPRATTDSESDLLSPFNKGFEKTKELINHLTKGMNKIKDEKEALELHNYPIKEHYLNALFTQIGHALVDDDVGRKNSAKDLLAGMPIKTKEQEAKFNEINGYSYDKDLKVKSEIDERYEQLKNLNGISSKLPDFDEKYKASVPSDSKENTPGKKRKKKGLAYDWLENKSRQSYKGLLTTTKGLAFFMTVGSIAEYMHKGKADKLKLHNVVGLVNDLLTVSSVVAEQGVKRLGDGSVKSVSKVVDKLMTVDKNSLKLIAKLGAIGVIVSTINTYSNLNENDTDAKIAVTTKNALVIALLFTPGWAAVVGIMAVELAWIFLKDHFIDSAMEIYLRKNLYFNNRQVNTSIGNSLSLSWSLFTNADIDRRYLSPILLDTLKTTSTDYTYLSSTMKGSELQGFSSIKELRTFVAENYQNNPLAFETAMSNELNIIKQVLYGLKIEADKEASSRVLKYQATRNNVFYLTSIRLPDDIMKNNENLIIRDKEDYKLIDKENEIVSSSTSYSLYDTLRDVQLNSREAYLDIKDTLEKSLIIVNSDIILKYTISYEVKTAYLMGTKIANSLEINELKQTALDTKDYEYIKSLVKKEEITNV